MNRILDRMALILTGLGFGAFFLGIFRFANQQDIWYGFFFIMYLLQSLDNSRLRKKLKELGHPDDLKSRIEARKAAQK